jgi:hypothetical protein
VLQNNTTYYVAGVSEEGCEGTRAAATVLVTVYDLPAIELFSESELKVNSAAGIQWYLNGTAIAGETGQILEMKESGQYGVEVNTQGCVAFTEGVFQVTSIEETLSENIDFYPNPASHTLYMENRTSKRVLMTLLNAQGKNMSSTYLQPSEKQTLDVREFAKGFYLVHVANESERIVRKIVIE